jgi:chaperonin GroEL
MEAVYEKPAIVVTDMKISSVQEFLPMLEKLAQAGKKDLVLIAEDVEGEAQATLILNKLKGVFNTVAVKAPAFGDRRKEILEDIAILTGATVISKEQGMSFEDAELHMVGTARKVIVGKDLTTIIEGAGDAKIVDARIKMIQAQADEATSEYDKEQYEKRAAALAGKVAVIKVGGASEVEIEEAKFRVDDAVAATKAALDEGIVAGGGVTLVDLSKVIRVEGTDGIAAGRQILKNALLQPFRQLMTNAGVNADEKLPEVAKSTKSGHGFDVNSPDKLIDLKAKGIVDPARVTKEAIMNAVSIAATAMTMGALVVDIPEKETAAPGGGGGMPGMGMM